MELEEALGLLENILEAVESTIEYAQLPERSRDLARLRSRLNEAIGILQDLVVAGA